MLSDHSNEYDTTLDLAAQGKMELLELMHIVERWLAADQNSDKVLELYRVWIDNSASPLVFVACFNCAVEYGKRQNHITAEQYYRKSLELNSHFLQARINLGNCLEQQQRDDEALDQWRTVLSSPVVTEPENRELRLHALNNLGRLLEVKRNYQEALSFLTLSLSLDATQEDVLYHLIPLRARMCEWPVTQPLPGLTEAEMLVGGSPLAVLALSDDPVMQLDCVRRFVTRKYRSQPGPLAPASGYGHDKLRIGYLSSDLSMHAVSLLTVELFECHNRECCTVYGFCWSREDGTEFRRRVLNAMDHVIRIGSLDDRQAAESIRNHEIDILIDLHGLTAGARPEILAYRPAPLQLTYLGFPGPTGLPWIDYVIADRYLIPEETTQYFTEKPLYIPHCFQVSDRKREIGPLPSRTEYSLPDNTFVFCCFNNNYKYTPELFASWVRILKNVPSSVLWLLADNEWAQEHILEAARREGVQEARLIFAPRVAPPAYLARYQLADLFLDTFPFNGGTTANDALFMGLPLLTLSGRSFASRMAGSLLNALELPELISSSYEEYEAMAIRCALEPGLLQQLRDRLIKNKALGPVFDTDLFVHALEDACFGLLRKRQVSQFHYSELSKSDTKQTTSLVSPVCSNIPGTVLCMSSVQVAEAPQYMPKSWSPPEQTIAIASIQRNRGPWILEWIAFHLLVGFNQFYIYAHKCVDDMVLKLLKLSRKYPIVVHQIDSDDRPQLACYQHAYDNYGHMVDWMAFIDGDEFLFPTADLQIGTALAAYETMPLSAVAAYWLCYGSSGHLTEPQGLLLENFRRHSNADFAPNHHVKSIVKGKQSGIVTTRSHIFTTPLGTYDELLRPIHHGCMEKLSPSYTRFRINHYVVQSFDFYRFHKRNMGAADGSNHYVRPPYWFFFHDRNECDDGVSYNYLISLKLKVLELENALLA